MRRFLSRLWPAFHRRAAWWSGTVVGLVSVAVVLSDGGWVRASYDWTHRLAGSGRRVPTDPALVVVYLDLESHLREKQDPTRPWDRRLHARLLRRLAASGARAVVFDVLFTDAGPDPEADGAFREALRAGVPVLLASETVRSSTGSRDGSETRAWRLQEPHPPFLEAAAGTGLADSRIDPDFVARELSDGFPALGQPSLSLAAARLLGVPSVAGPRRWIRYYGPPLSLPHVGYSQALRPDETPDELFRDRIVVVGARPTAGVFGERRDEFRSPFRTWRDPDRFLPGAELRATELLNWLRGDWLRRLPPGLEAALLLVAAIGTARLVFRLRPTLAVVAGASILLGVVLAASMAFRGGLWFPWLLVAGGQVPALLSSSIVLHSVDWYREKRRLTARMRQLRRLEAIGSLAGGLVHDLNNALGPVLMGLGVLRRRLSDPESDRLLRLMEAGVHRGVGMVRHVLLFARGQDDERPVVSVPVILADLVSFLRGSFPAGIRIDLMRAETLWPVVASAPQLHQVLLNLCVNARDAMPSGGDLFLAAENVVITQDEANRFHPPLESGRHVVITVQDDGQGMDQGTQARVFEPFFTTKSPGLGTGLGLSTSLHLLKIHRGGLRFRSAPGEGTTFEIALPAATSVLVQPPACAAASRAPGRGESIVILEEEETFGSLLFEALGAHGYQVVMASTRHPPTSPVHLIVFGMSTLDMTSLAWIGDVRSGSGSGSSGTPVLFTGLDAVGLASSGLVPPIVGALPRPFRIESFLLRVRQLLDHHRESVSPGRMPRERDGA